MQNHYPLWKYLVLGLLVVLAFLYALPNVFGEDPALQISPNKFGARVTDEKKDTLVTLLNEHNIRYKDAYIAEDGDLMFRFLDSDSQLKFRDILSTQLNDDYTVALNLMPATPKWLSQINALPMKLGLDLRGGVHFLLDVDINSVFNRREEGLVRNIGKELRQEQIRYTGIKRNPSEHSVTVRFKDESVRDEAYGVIQKNVPDILLQKISRDGIAQIQVTFPPNVSNTIRQNTIEQTMSTLRNRVNELGVAEAVVQQQGAQRIAVDLPGIQDAARAKEILGGTATVEFRMVSHEHDAYTAYESGTVPVGTKLFEYHGRPLLLKSQIILSGDSITGAVSSFDQQSASPSVQIQLGGGGESLFNRTTRENVGKNMAIVFVETKTEVKTVGDKEVKVRKKVERVISNATIQSALGSNFHITGLENPLEARNLALLLRAGALPAAIDIVEERTVGPTLGMENIERGIVSLQVGIVIVMIFMAVYYRFFGLVANIALVLNLVMLVAILSLINATLTLPGIAGIVLTMGMAVDANVLIYERIREELRNGATPQAAIYAGYERAFATIVDANLTTLIVAVVLLAIGSGAIQAFAITLIFGLLTSMLTGVACTRAMVNLCYGGRRVQHLSIGIKH